VTCSLGLNETFRLTGGGATFSLAGGTGLVLMLRECRLLRSLGRFVDDERDEDDLSLSFSPRSLSFSLSLSPRSFLSLSLLRSLSLSLSLLLLRLLDFLDDDDDDERLLPPLPPSPLPDDRLPLFRLFLDDFFDDDVLDEDLEDDEGNGDLPLLLLFCTGLSSRLLDELVDDDNEMADAVSSLLVFI